MINSPSGVRKILLAIESVRYAFIA
jgi:hypothetical protein